MVQVDIIKHSTNCKQRVTLDSKIQIRYISRLLNEPSQVIENKTISLNPGDTTLVKSLEQEIQGLCIGDICRLTFPPAFHAVSDGQISNEAMIYDIEILDISKPQVITPLFWFVLCSIGLAYILLSKLAARVDREKDTTRSKQK
ncbi:MAG: hypothetical protein EXX96DRAFT_560157 [Benjaminiella poitrasii]|nr:MAG: hypothetical protein EXX96DRAFT_560157 [Benjaminiella poitrasii]